jgi:alkanesulfonate monooxygenase SsuD/methylene tetrahydromethanopterin reductase-like flavin-dependent oxidoreductase (luciferase family)
VFDTPAEREAETQAMRDTIGQLALMLIALSPSPDAARTKLTDWLLAEADAALRRGHATTGDRAAAAMARAHVMEELRGLIEYRLDRDRAD